MDKLNFYKLQQVIKLLDEADALLQEALGDSEECYYIATQIQNASDDVCDIVRAADEDSVEVVSVEDGKYYSSEYTSGSTVNVTLRKGNTYAKCEGILIWEEEMAEEAWEEWVAMAEEGEEGYTVWTE